MIYLLKMVLLLLIKVFKSRYKWLIILFFVWLFRVDFIQDTGDGVGKALQIGSLIGIVFFIVKYKRSIFYITFFRTNYTIKSCVILYIFGTLSALWSIMPMFSFYMGFQNVILLVAVVWMLSICHSFKGLEKSFLLSTVICILFESIALRLTWQPSLFVHHLASGSSAAICISYCIGELLCMKKKDTERKRLLTGCVLVSIIVLVTSTSSGANASAVFGIAIGLLLSRKIFWAFLLFATALFLYYNQHMIESLLLFIMPGKTMAVIESKTGRTLFWNEIYRLIDYRPLLGYGFACIERAISKTLDIAIIDAHNSYLGIYGSLGVIGSIIFYIHLGITLITILRNYLKPGFLGVFAGICCALLNGYSFGFLSGKGCSIIIIYFFLVALTFFYIKVKKYDD